MSKDTPTTRKLRATWSSEITQTPPTPFKGETTIIPIHEFKTLEPYYPFQRYLGDVGGVMVHRGDLAAAREVQRQAAAGLPLDRRAVMNAAMREEFAIELRREAEKNLRTKLSFMNNAGEPEYINDRLYIKYNSDKTTERVRSIIFIRENATGKVVREVDHSDPHTDEDYGISTYWWSDGNAECDCNRKIFFLRSQGLPTEGKELDEDGEPIDITPCGSGAFSVLILNPVDLVPIYADGGFNLTHIPQDELDKLLAEGVPYVGKDLVAAFVSNCYPATN